MPAERPPMVWWGWGDPADRPDLGRTAEQALDRLVGLGRPRGPVPQEAAVLPEPVIADRVLARLTEAAGAAALRTDRRSRLLHAGGRSYPDLVRLRAGDAAAAPDAVVVPGDHDAVARVLAVCSEEGVAVVPHGGGTSVVGGVGAGDRSGFAGVVTLSLARMAGLAGLDRRSLVARFGPGTRGADAEAALAGAGLTLGHLPQSHEYATLGGYVATRSVGQASTGYGRIDDLVAGLQCATPVGDLDLPPVPSGAGPDLRRLLLGSEGTLGVITEVAVRVRPAPETRRHEAWLFRSFASGTEALRAATQAGAAPDVARLSDEDETATTLALSAGRLQAAGVRLYARARSVGGGAMAILGWEGDPRAVRRRRHDTAGWLGAAGGVPAGQAPGQAWERSRFEGGYVRDALLDRGLFVDTFETAAPWSRLLEVRAAVRNAVADVLARRGTPPLLGCHVSHLYPTGASLYFTVIAHAETGCEVDQWEAAKRAATDALVAAGAPVTHHHAVGRHHRPWLADQLGAAGVAALRGAKERLDPAGILNPGVLL